MFRNKESKKKSTSVEDKMERKRDMSREIESRTTFVVDHFSDTPTTSTVGKGRHSFLDDVIKDELKEVAREMESRATYTVEGSTSSFDDGLLDEFSEDGRETPISDIIDEIMENTKTLVDDNETSTKDKKSSSNKDFETDFDMDKFIEEFLAEMPA